MSLNSVGALNIISLAVLVACTGARADDDMVLVDKRDREIVNKQATGGQQTVMVGLPESKGIEGVNHALNKSVDNNNLKEVIALPSSNELPVSLNHNVPTTTAKNVESGLYRIEFNKEFNSLVEVEVEKDFLYLPIKSLDNKIIDKFSFETVVRAQQRWVRIPTSQVLEVNTQDMVMSIILQDLKDNSVHSKRLNYTQKDESRIDRSQVANYLNNNYELSLDNFNRISGFLSTKYSNRDYWSVQNNMLYSTQGLVRLASTYKREFSDKSALQIGDLTEDSNNQLVAVNGLGIKYATNYFNNNANSNLIQSLPQYAVNGFSLTTSNFNLYSASSALISSEVSSGNYNIIMPYNNGYGVYNGYVKDYLGNVQTFNMPYYNSTQLTKAQGFEYSVSVASLRRNLYYSSFDYSKPFVSAVSKYGVTSNWTQDLNIHMSDYFKNVYTGANFYLDPKYGLFQAGVNYNGQQQKLYTAGWEHYSSLPIVFKFTKSHSAEGFCIEYLNDCIKDQTRYFLTLRGPENYGNLSLQQLHEQKLTTNYTTRSLVWSRNIDNKINVSVILEKTKYQTTQKDNSKFLALLTYNLDSHLNASVSAQSTSQYDSIQARLYRGEDKAHPEYGYGFASIGSTAGNANYNINYGANLQHFSYRVQANQTANFHTTRVGMNGSVLYIPEEHYLSFNKNTEGVVLVDTQNTGEPIEIYHQNKLSGLTDKEGRYVITKSTPYATEKVELNLKTLPVDKNFEEFKYSLVVPEYGAAKIKFKPLMQDYPIVVDLPEASIFSIEGQPFIVGAGGEASVNREGVARSETGCTFMVKIGVQTYHCGL